MGTRYLVDSNIIIKTATEGAINANVRAFVANIIDVEFNISVITKIEVSIKNDHLKKYLNTANVFDIEEHVVLKTIELRRKYKIKPPDAIIAATAIVHNFVLLTTDSRIKHIKGLTVVNPFELK